MLIACKCLNVTLNSTSTKLLAAMPVATASISNYDDIAYKTNASNASQSTHTVPSPSVNQRDNLEDNRNASAKEQQSTHIQCSTAENLDSNQLQFFRTVNKSTFNQ